MAELRAMAFDQVLRLPARTVCAVRVGRSDVEVSETVRELPSSRLFVQIEAWRKSLWRKPVLLRAAGVLFSSSGRVREASEAELRELSVHIGARRVR